MLAPSLLPEDHARFLICPFPMVSNITFCDIDRGSQETQIAADAGTCQRTQEDLVTQMQSNNALGTDTELVLAACYAKLTGDK